MVEWEKQFFDRRGSGAGGGAGGSNPSNQQHERRQFADSHEDLSPEAREFAQAVDRHKLQNGRKFITLGEIYQIFIELGYRR